jgi:hypothetical protein
MPTYTINVALLRKDADGKERYRHHFRVVTDFQTKEEAIALFYELKERYPAPAYSLSFSETRTTSYDLTSVL